MFWNVRWDVVCPLVSISIRRQRTAPASKDGLRAVFHRGTETFTSYETNRATIGGAFIGVA
ncbi:hypothetical protein [Halocatena marina]|uniref:hypothetical protein n=1 Tax=Halocatena marina TaxID=2934937 RepID=UPI00200FC708|nr:hypothetical protein [Halocatena marina]